MTEIGPMECVFAHIRVMENAIPLCASEYQLPTILHVCTDEAIEECKLEREEVYRWDSVSSVHPHGELCENNNRNLTSY